MTRMLQKMHKIRKLESNSKWKEMRATNMFWAIFRAPAIIMLCIQDGISQSAISKNAKIGYCHTTTSLNAMKELGYVTFKPQEREVLVEITQKGKKIQDELLQIKNILGA